MATIQIPVLFDMSGDTIVFGEEVTGDFVSSHLDFILDMTTEANDISLNAADISGSILIGDNDSSDNIFYSGGTNSNIGIDNLCNRISKAVTRGKLVHIPKSGNTSNSGIPMGGRANIYKADGTIELPPDGKYAIKYNTSVSPIGDEQMLGQAMARIASIHLVGSPLAAGIFQDANQIQTDLETASAQTFNSGGTAFYNALAVQLSKVLGGSKSSTPMNNGKVTGGDPSPLASQLYYENFNGEDALPAKHSSMAYVTGYGGTGKALSNTAASPGWEHKTSNSTLPANAKVVSFWIKMDSSTANPGYILDAAASNTDPSPRGPALVMKGASGLKVYNDSATLGGNLPDIYYNGTLQTYTVGTAGVGHAVGTISKNLLTDGNWHHFYLSYPNVHTEFNWFAFHGSDYGAIYALDDLRYFSAPLTQAEITNLAAGGNGNPNAGPYVYPLDASGVANPALKSIYEQLMNVPHRSQIMQTQDVSGTVDNSNTTLTGGFPFIAGDRLVMYLRPKIVFAAQTFAEQTATLTGFSQISFTVPVYDVGRKSSAGGAISTQTYTHSSAYDAGLGFDKCFEGTSVDSASVWNSGDNQFHDVAPFDHDGGYTTTNVDGPTTLSGSWGQVDIGENTYINKFIIWAAGGTKRRPDEYSLLGSLNGTNWTTIKYVAETVGGAGQDDTTNLDANAIETFILNEIHGPYRYFRLSVKSINDTDKQLSMNGLLLYGAKYPSELDLHSSTAGAPSSQPTAQAITDISGLITNVIATAADIQTAFPGNATTGPEAEALKWGWVGSANSDSLSLDTTDEQSVRTCDLHIWKITITL